MKTLLVKEIRLLLPAYGAALLLATVPVWLLPTTYGSTIPAPAFYAFCFGAVMLALSSFGREFSLKTFPLILAQPLERRRIWWTKVALLGAAMATVLTAWCLCCVTRSYPVYAVYGQEPSVWREALTYGGAT
ncbi:MAG TPA: hypothetical protein VNZ22_16245, partial [Bacillota bacterium]|nr:hypothetical protein [Bacillota bacterium]